MKIAGLFVTCLIILVTMSSPLPAADVSSWCPDGQKAFSAGKYEQASQALNSCLYNPPEDPVLASEGYYLRGQTYIENLDNVAALGDLELAVELWPENAEAWRAKASVHARQEDYLNAIKSIEQALAVDPHSTKSNFVHASILTAMDRPDLAMDAYDLAFSFESRETVRRLQQALEDAGFKVGAIDGVYGAATRNAIRACIADGCTLSM